MSESLYEKLPMPDLSPDGRRQVRMTKWTRYGDAQAAWLAEHDFGIFFALDHPTAWLDA